MASLFLLLLLSSVSHSHLFFCLLLSGLKKLKQLYSNVLAQALFSFPLSCLFFLAWVWILIVVLGRKCLMDSQRRIHDMVMRFKFVRHFWPEKKRGRLWHWLCPVFHNSRILAIPVVIFKCMGCGDKEKNRVEMRKQVRNVVICHFLPK